MPNHQADVVVEEYADCVVGLRSERPAVIKFLRAIPGSDAASADIHKVFNESCAEHSAVHQGASFAMTMKLDTYRAVLYSALYRHDFPAGASADLAALAPLQIQTEFDGDLNTLPAAYLPSRAFGDCIARQDSPDARAMLFAKPYATEETEALAKLQPAMANCIGKGQTLHLTRLALRAYVGEAMYKLAVAARLAATMVQAGTGKN